MAEALRIIEVC